MWQLAASLWHQLSPEEVEEWERAGTTRGMTGFAWYMSQALRPNPGIYLPLAGGNMTGQIDMQWQQITGLPPPLLATDAARKTYVDWRAREEVTRPAVRARRTTNQTIQHNTVTTLSFDMEDHDNDTMWEGVTNPDRITIQTAGIYIILGQVQWAASAAGYRGQLLQHSSAGLIAQTHTQQSDSINLWRGNVATTWDCEVGDYIELLVIHTAGADLDCIPGGMQAPVLEAVRAG
ncbi:unnamed protein product [marine sediment metagenome]|uniref:Uncharacterized protein n=1 Tax=marine sediment metagenome TaxID=412755 RepID=X1S134_9ZZZZ